MNSQNKYLLNKKIKELEKSIDSEIASNPQSTEKDISTLIQNNQLEEAEKLIFDNKLSESWCHKAITVYVLRNKIELAKKVIKWARQNSNKLYIWRLCIYEFAKARWRMICGYDPEGMIVLPGIIGQEKKKDINEILKVVKPVLLHIEVDECVSSELEAKILFVAINAFWLLGDIEKVRKLALYLETVKPASIELANLAMMGLVKRGSLKNDFPERLNNENPDSFNAKILSQLLKAEIFGQSLNAFESLKAFSPEIKKEDRLRYCQGLFHVAQLLGKSEVEECIRLSEELLGKENSFCKLAKAEYLLNLDEIDEAEEIAKSCIDKKNPQWLQIYAFIQAKKENFEGAIKNYEEASKLMAHPEVFATLGRLATLASEKDDRFRNNVIEAYKSLLNLQSDNLSARHNLAFELARSGRLQEAKDHFKYLSEHSPEEDPSGIIYKQNYGNCLANTGEHEKALMVYDEICRDKDVPVEAVIVKTNLLKQVKDPFIAFNFLQQYRKLFWNIPSYLQHYMKLSSQANQDGLMHEALLQIKKLQSQGKASPDVIQEKTLEDIIEKVKQWNERTRQIHDFCLKGKMPWTLADDMLNHSIYMGWLIRTQKLNWFSEEPATTASYSIYATNSFHPLKSDDGKVSLQRLNKPLYNSEVVMDITALITLHRLGLLDKAMSFFKTIYIPALYLFKLFKDSDKLLPHQYSNVKAICEIKEAVDNARIDVLEDLGTPFIKHFPYINEHTLPEDEEHYYRLVDILNVLEEKGFVRKNELENIKNIKLKPAGVDHDHPAININDELIIELSSLKTICNFDLLDKVLDNFKVKISSEFKKQILSDFSNIEHQKKLQEWNKDLRDIIISTDSFKKIDIDLDVRNREEFSLKALKLAIQKNLPLYSDDRVLQVAALNDKSQIISFGIDVFVNTLHSQGHLNLTELTNIYLQLIDWRYKFFIPPLKVLIYLAEQYSNNPPGNELKKIAMYTHDCMRDPGLFCGQEKTADVPLPIAVKIYIEWFRLAADFIVKCWTNKNININDETAEKYTDWTILNLLPTYPKYIHNSGSFGSMTKRMVLGDAITQLMTISDIDMGNKILLLLKQKLGLSDIEYNRTVSEIIDAI